MTIKELEQYRQLQQEVLQLSWRLERLQDTKSHIVTDTVRGSSHQNPYQERIIPITGLSQKYMETYNHIRRLLQARIERTRKEIVAIEEFISTVEDSAIRRIIDYRYIQGLSWAATTKRVYNYAHKDTARKALERFFQKK